MAKHFSRQMAKTAKSYAISTFVMVEEMPSE
jgi:hypothetical protein